MSVLSMSFSSRAPCGRNGGAISRCHHLRQKGEHIHRRMLASDQILAWYSHPPNKRKNGLKQGGCSDDDDNDDVDDVGQIEFIALSTGCMTMMTMATFISLANILSNTVSARDRGLSSASGRGGNRRRLRSAARASQAVRVGCCSLWVIRFLSRRMDGSNDLRKGSRAPETVLASFSELHTARW